ncbi:DUF3854 domain-containing protein [Barnesiella viscericola]|uniref:DUF3854 domain-containing protein n=1 Tax=Barnesiella viscericola TaxID=397865 RepID=UPI00248E3A98|nr:DUF3854 domain-containing protein [Barnesiella viscericola]
MKKYNKFDIDRVKSAADIRDFIPGLSGRGATQYCECPECHKSGRNKGLCVTHKTNMDIAKCFSCGFTINGAIDAVQYYDKVEFIEALQIVASRYNILLETESEKRQRAIDRSREKVKQSFCLSQLEASGLTVKDVTAKVRLDDKSGEIYLPAFQRGGMDKYFNINKNDDEMLIYYYDLWGNPVQYATRGAAGSLKPYVRIRWSNPSLHLDKDGREIKYQTPKGAPTKFYIPQYIRERFLSETHIETLIVQEGEKKAEKACKHGIASIGIQGIYNIGNAETGLIQDLQYLVQKCTIKNVVLLMDSDWDHLHREIQIGDHVDQRPNQFAKAVIKFKQYVQTMHNIGVSVDIFFGHINDTPSHDKGIDDLLCNTLKGREEVLRKEIDTVMHTHDGKGQFLDIYKITSKTDFQIKDFWLLNDRDGFFERHKEELLQIPNFRFAKINYRIEDGKLVQASRYSSERDFWVIGANDKGKKTVDFDYIEALQFISANGFYRIHTSDLEVDQYKFVRIDDGVVHLSGPTEIRDFVYYYALQTCKDRDVITMLASRLGSLLGPDKLERITKIDDNFDNFEPHIQRMYYRNGQIQITSRGIEFGDLLGQVWSDKVIRRKFKRVPVIDKIEYDPVAGFSVFPTEEGKACEFFQFICNTSNFWNIPGHTPTDQEEREFQQHVVNKITSIGFLMCDYKYQTELKAVIAMDGQMGEVAQSNGRTGKSLVGAALAKILDQTAIDGRNTKNDDDYIYSNVTPRTRNIFIDDVKVNFDFERFFFAVTGDLAVNPKTKARFIIPNEKSPKFYITTNHAINANNRSALEHITYMAFSDWYNDNHRPIDDFGHQFFADWDEDQWNLFDNFMAECCMFYFKSMAESWYRTGQGAVPPPMRDIKMRTLKQQMGEAFVQWAETYFDESANNLNERIPRKTMYDAYHSSFPDSKFGVTPSNFRTKVVLYCDFKGYHFNVSRPNKSGISFRNWIDEHPGETFVGEADKSGGVEYFGVFSLDFAKKQPF